MKNTLSGIFITVLLIVSMLGLVACGGGGGGGSSALVPTGASIRVSIDSSLLGGSPSLRASVTEAMRAALPSSLKVKTVAYSNGQSVTGINIPERNATLNGDKYVCDITDLNNAYDYRFMACYGDKLLMQNQISSAEVVSGSEVPVNVNTSYKVLSYDAWVATNPSNCSMANFVSNCQNSGVDVSKEDAFVALSSVSVETYKENMQKLVKGENAELPTAASVDVSGISKETNTEPEPQPEPQTPSSGNELKFTLPRNNAELIMVKCPDTNGSYVLLGSPESEEGRDEKEIQHKVQFTKPFYIGKFEFTQEQFVAIASDEDYNDIDHGLSGFTRVYNGTNAGNRKPYFGLYYYKAIEICNLLNQKLSSKIPAGYKFALPTEAQWEYACRAGTTSKYNNNTDNNLDEVGWYIDNSSTVVSENNYIIHEVGSKKPNAWGIYDMHGNVSEWCSDYYRENYYSTLNEGDRVAVDPKGPDSSYIGNKRVKRGGCVLHYANGCRSAFRDYDLEDPPQERYGGLRVALVPID